MSQEELIIFVFNGTVYILVIALIALTLKVALTKRVHERSPTQEARRIVTSPHGPEQEAEEIIYELLEEV